MDVYPTVIATPRQVSGPIRHKDPFLRSFELSGLTYTFSAFDGGPVCFRIASGGTARKWYEPAPSDWPDDDDTGRFTDTGFFPNAAPVFRAVVYLIGDWTRQEKPYLFHFKATDSRKHRLYQRLIERYGAALNSRYAHYMAGREFYFVRKG